MRVILFALSFLFAIIGTNASFAASIVCGDYSDTGQSTCPASCVWKGGITGCSYCENGTYTDAAGLTSCSPCSYPTSAPGSWGAGGDNWTSNGASGNGCSWTFNCPAKTQWGGSSCVGCPSGSYSDANITYTGTGTTFSSTPTCTPCAAGTYQDNTGQESCKACPNDKFQDETGQSSCKTCDAGYHPSVDQKSCEGNKYTVKFDVGTDAESQNDKYCTYGTSCGWINTTVKEGSTFLYWSVPAGVYGSPSATASSLPSTFFNPSLAEPHGSATIILKAVWLDCTNGEGVADDDGWIQGQDCIIAKCKFGYYLDSNHCIGCYSSGMYCDGTAEGERPCPKGWYCPIFNTPGTIVEDCTDSTDSDGVTIIGFPPTDGISAHTGKCKCPAGATTSGTASKSIESCSLKGGSGGTKFCDSAYRCFYLPSDVPYRIN